MSPAETLLFILLAPFATAATPEAHIVDFPANRIPRSHWTRELVWLKNIGISAILCDDATPDFLALANQAGLTVVSRPAAVRKVSALSAAAVIESRRSILDHETVLWTDVESLASPEYRKGAVTLSGEEEPATQPLRREAALFRYWSTQLTASTGHTQADRLPETLQVTQREAMNGAALSVMNSARIPWTGTLHAYLPSLKHSVEIPGVTVPGNDALLLPLDIPLSNPAFCKACSGMANSERLVYATAELTAIEFENGILSFEFYAPKPARVILQLEREPAGPMLAGGRLVEYQWDAENLRASLPIPAGRDASRKSRIAIVIAAPDESAGFVDLKTMVIGQTNHIVTEYSSEAIAHRSRLIAPEGWKVVRESSAPLRIGYAIDVPPEVLHGARSDLRLEADGIAISHVRVQLLRPVSVHVAEALPLHFGAEAELAGDPPLVPVESPGGRNITLLLRNNAPEIRTFHVELGGELLEFSPASTDISVGASMEREISFRVFLGKAGPGLQSAIAKISGPTAYEKLLRFVVLPRGESVVYSADLTGCPPDQTVFENSRIRAVFSRPDGGRWLEFYWKESGKSLLPAHGVDLTAPVKIELKGDDLSIAGAAALPRGGKIGNVEWKAESTGGVTRYRIIDAAAK